MFYTPAASGLHRRLISQAPSEPCLGEINRKKLKSCSRLFSFERDCSPANERNDLQEAARDRSIRTRRRVHAKADEATGGDDSRGARLSLGRGLQNRQR